MDDNGNDVVVPVVAEELHADAVPVETGGVRVTKHIETHDEVLAQELRKTHVDVKRVKTNRVVDGPQPVQRTGKTLIVPVTSEVLRIEKQWVVTEEIHITEREEREAVEQKVEVKREVPVIERLDENGKPVQAFEPEPQTTRQQRTSLVAPANNATAEKRKPLSRPRSILRKP